MNSHFCCVCQRQVLEDEPFFSELIGGNALIWTAHEACLPACPRCSYPLARDNCRLRKAPMALFGYVPEHQHCPKFAVSEHSAKAAT
jgi:hypothetical protein